MMKNLSIPHEMFPASMHRGGPVPITGLASELDPRRAANKCALMAVVLIGRSELQREQWLRKKKQQKIQ
jgi:hypothetical protein